jgi:hypothetical protein
MASSRAPDRELILSQHEFPGEYVIKVFGPGDSTFRAGVQAAVGHLQFRSSERATRSGSRICITLVLAATSVDEVIDAYERLHGLETLQLIL